jgi:hypothetical protein
MSVSSMRPLGDFHHYRAGAIDSKDRVALCERRVIDMLLTSSLPDASRESSITFELKHHHSVAQLGRILARQRNLPIEVCTAGALLHDIHVICHGTYDDHAHLGAPLALEILRDTGGFAGTELEQVHAIVFHHSDKHIWSTDPLAEFGKDADVLDCFLYPGAFEYYLRHKSLASFAAYLTRAKAVWSELSIPPDPRFDLLDGFEAGWLGRRHTLSRAQASATLGALELLASAGPDSGVCPPPFAVVRRGETTELATNAEAWDAFTAHIEERPENTASALGAEVARLDSLRGLLHLNNGEISPADVAVIAGPITSGALNAAPELARGAIVVWPVLGRYEEVPPAPAISLRSQELGL